MTNYSILLFIYITGTALSGLFLFLLLKKAVDNFYTSQRSKYGEVLFDKLSCYVTDGDMQIYYRSFNPDKKWKREIITDILYRQASMIKSEEEMSRIRQLCQRIGLTGQLMKQMNDNRWWIVAEAIGNAGKIGLTDCLPLIVKKLNDEHYDVWTSSARALSRMNRNDLLVDYLVEKEKILQRWSLIRIGDMLMQGGESGVDKMIEILNQVSPLLQGIFIETLGKKKVARAVPVIEGYLSSPDMELRVKALKAIRDIGLTTQEDLVIQKLSSENWEEKVISIQVVQSCSIRQAVPTLVERLSDANWWVRLRSAEALYHFGLAGRNQLEWVSKYHKDPYAKDIAVKVIEEKEIEVISS